jgi:hypothetical protein
MPSLEYAHGGNDVISEQHERFIEFCMHNEGLWEHFSDHLIIAISFFALGMIVNTLNWHRKSKNRVFMIDYDLKKGTIMRLFHNGKKTLVVNPSSLVEWFDIIFLQYFDKGKDKFIDRHDKRRIRWLTNFLLLCVLILSLSGVLLILSAFNTDMNIFNYLPF